MNEVLPKQDLSLLALLNSMAEKKKEINPFILDESMLQLLAKKPANKLDRIVERAAARLGYIDGLNQFIEEHNLESDQLVHGNNFLEENSGLRAFIAGIKFTGPSGHTVYNPSHASYAYQLGLMVYIAHNFGITASRNEVPYKAEGFDALRNGCNGKPAALTEGETVLVALGKDRVKSIDKDYEANYQLGLKMWIKQNELDVKVEDIRHPEALAALSAALNGKMIGEYDVDAPGESRIVREHAQRMYDIGKEMQKGDDE